MKVAVVGAGLAGLSAAWWLGRQGHQVTLYERQARPGFTASSVSVSESESESASVPASVPGRGGEAQAAQRVDVPLRVFYPGYYPTLTALYQALGVPTEPVSYASTLHDAAGTPYFRYRNLRWGGKSVSVLAPQDLLLGRRAWRIGAGLWRFQRDARAALHGAALADLSIGAYVQAQGYGADFVDGLLLPAIATVCTCSHAQARHFPARVILDYLARGLASQPVHRALHGADDVERRLLAGIPDLRCDARLASAARHGPGVRLQMADGSTADYDHLVLATQANQASALLADASPDEAAMLAGFTYTPVAVVTHRDERLLPARRRDWSPVNLRLDPAQDGPASTIWVNAVQPALRGAADVFQTVNPHLPPRADRLIARSHFQRPVVDARSEQALGQLQALHAQAGRRVWFCGSYAQAGIPLLESAVRSAQAVAQRLGAGPGLEATPGWVAHPGLVAASSA